MKAKIENLYYFVTFSNGETWRIPVMKIAEDRARRIAEYDSVSYEESLNNDTLPLFRQSHYEIEDWAKNNMDWGYLQQFATKVETKEVDYEEEWCNADVKIADYMSYWRK